MFLWACGLKTSRKTYLKQMQMNSSTQICLYNNMIIIGQQPLFYVAITKYRTRHRILNAQRRNTQEYFVHIEG